MVCVSIPAADRSLLYFLSDGQPTTAGNDIPPSEVPLEQDTIDAWEAFLSRNLTPSIAVGIGSSASAADPDLQDVAVPNDPFDDNPILVLDESGLIPTLLATVDNVVTGNVLDNDDFGPDGQGTPAITQIVVDGVTYTFDGTDITRQDPTPTVIPGAVLTVMTLLGGELEFNFSDGGFTYTAGQVTGNPDETFTYTIQDSNGDTAASSLVVTVLDQSIAPVAVADTVITQSDSTDIADASISYETKGRIKKESRPNIFMRILGWIF